MAFHAGSGVTVLFGGIENPTRFNDTWEWNGTNWVQTETTGPAPRYDISMAYDSARGVCVLFGGLGSSIFDDTWEYTPGSTPVQSATWGMLKHLFGRGGQ